jgi:hypothetical protein
MSAMPADYWRRRRALIAAGGSLTVPVAPIRRHLSALRRHGVPVKVIADAVGIPNSTVYDILSGRTATMERAAGAKLAAVTLDDVLRADLTACARVPNVGTVRRIRALQLAGWRHADLSTLVGVDTSRLDGDRIRWVTRATHDAVADLTRTLTGRTGPSTRTAARARTAGYLPLSAWDDVDDPAPARPMSVSDTDEAVRMVARGDTVDQAAATYGLEPDSVMTALRRRAVKAGPGTPEADLHRRVVAQRTEASTAARVEANRQRRAAGRAS